MGPEERDDVEEGCRTVVGRVRARNAFGSFGHGELYALLYSWIGCDFMS
jgi:hypothetical protein